jgi:hypothetical protein
MWLNSYKAQQLPNQSNVLLLMLVAFFGFFCTINH